MVESPDDLVEVAGDRVGDALRCVATYRDREHEFLFLRDDIASRYSEAEIREVFDELAMSGLSRDYLERLFHAGRIECSVYGFEEAAMFHFVRSDDAGAFVSVDRDVDINLDAFISRCRAALA